MHSRPRTRRLNVLQRITLGYWLLVIPLAVAGVLMIVTVALVQSTYVDKQDKATAVKDKAAEFRFDLATQVALVRTLLAVGEAGGSTLPDARAGLSSVTAHAQSLEAAVARATHSTFEGYPGFERSWRSFQATAQRAVAGAAAGKKGAATSSLGAALAQAATDTDAAAGTLSHEAQAVYDRTDTAMWRFVYETLGVALVIILLGALAGFALAIWLPRSVARQLRRVIGALASATSQMLAVVARVASSSVETATAISEAATTVDEVRQTSLLSSQKATAVSDDAQRSGEVAEAGRGAVAETVADIEHIQQQMTVVAETVARMSEQTESVEAIMQTVNQLAEQSSLLAVNAAIEATSAGEHGKGFGVVADEIRSLAVSSKSSVAQVRQILSEIQRATGAAVMATEQSARAIERGVRRARESSEAIDSLTDSVETASRSAMQIAASSQQQLVGMDQIAEAMASIDQAGTQNSSGAAQLEAGVAQIEEMAGELRGLVSSINPLAALIPGRRGATAPASERGLAAPPARSAAGDPSAAEAGGAEPMPAGPASG